MDNYDTNAALSDAFTTFQQVGKNKDDCIFFCKSLHHKEFIWCKYCHRQIGIECDSIIVTTPPEDRKCYDCEIIIKVI